MGKAGDYLSNATLNELIGAAQKDPSDGSEAMNEIVRRFQGVAVRIAVALTRREALRDDLGQAALIALTRAVRRHDPSRTGFARYAKRYMDGAAKRELKIWTEGNRESLSDPAVWRTACEVAAPTSQLGTHKWGYGRAGQVVHLLPERQRQLLSQRYLEDDTLAEIAVVTGTSVPAVSQRLATVHRVIERLLIA